MVGNGVIKRSAHLAGKQAEINLVIKPQTCTKYYLLYYYYLLHEMSNFIHPAAASKFQQAGPV